MVRQKVDWIKGLAIITFFKGKNNEDYIAVRKYAGLVMLLYFHYHSIRRINLVTKFFLTIYNNVREPLIFRRFHKYLSTDYFGTRQIIFDNNMNTIEMLLKFYSHHPQYTPF